MIASDIDGTLLDYDHVPGASPAINHALIAQLAERTDRIALVSNQGGLPWGMMGTTRRDGGRYPLPVDFVTRLTDLRLALSEAGISVASVHVCVWHPKAPEQAIKQAAAELSELLDHWLIVRLYDDSMWRKPSPNMLIAAGASCYYGDSDEDQDAAQSAGIEFVCVGRFYRPQGDL